MTAISANLILLSVALPACQTSETKTSWTPAEYQPKSEWQYELPEEAKPLMPRFQRALHDGQWDQALSLCSWHVRDKASTYESIEAFFRAVVPIKEVVDARQYLFWQYKGSPRVFPFGFMRTYCIPELQEEHRTSWQPEVRETATGWVITFPTSTLAYQNEWKTASVVRDRMAHKIRQEWRRRAEIARKLLKPRLAKLQATLSPVNKSFVLGRPMPFRIELLNHGEHRLIYGSSTPTLFNTGAVTITDEVGNTVRYVGPGQTIFGERRTIKPGATVVLADAYDINKNYDFKKPGRYKVQFTGKLSLIVHPDDICAFRRRIPSNTVEIEITE